MEKVVTKGRIPVKLWLDDIEEGALQQAINLSNLPFAFKHIAIMPDSHQGYGMPIGGVLATKGTIIPNAVGVDIGCGMCVQRTSLNSAHLEVDTLKEILSDIRKNIPVGFNHHKEAVKDDILNLDNYKVGQLGTDSIAYQENQKAAYQIGTLGGGNHFIEIQKDQEGYVWIMIHSGSRNIGYTTAKHYHQLAVEWCNKWFSNIPSKNLAFFPEGTQLYDDYIDEMNYCIEFAQHNRDAMMSQVEKAFNRHIQNIDFYDYLNKPHNFADIEHHYNSNVIIHRKGATRARKGEKGMIPGSQGTCSYIVTGKGNEESFHSCSHGAGRVMSRTKARNELNLKDEINSLDDKDILHAIRSEGDLDEAPSAYKDIDEVMSLQEDLVKIEVKLEPLAVIKG